MKPVVFSGPSLTPEAAARLFPEARCLGPATQGDVLRALREAPRAICLIDGYFEHVPAVTHKELLWALHQGVPCYGAASMGALRAAELAAFGMIGFGHVFAAYAAGELEDDDEVAMAHADATHGYRPASFALVDLRATLAHGRTRGVLDEATSHALIASAKAMFYADRTLPALLERAAAQGCTPAAVGWLRDPAHWVDQKRRDATALLAHVRAALSRDGLPTPAPPGPFPHTDAWDRLLREVNAAPSGEEDLESAQAVLTEVRLLGLEVFEDMLSAATRRALALGSHDASAHEAPSEAAVLRALQAALRHVPHVLRDLGDYDRALSRATRKRLAAARHASGAVMRDDDLHWYFRERLRREVPADLDAYAARLQLSSAAHLRALIAEERRFVAPDGS